MFKATNCVDLLIPFVIILLWKELAKEAHESHDQEFRSKQSKNELSNCDNLQALQGKRTVALNTCLLTLCC